MKTAVKHISLALVILTLVACAGRGKLDQPPAYEERPVSELYNEASDELARGNFVKATTLFEEVERQHPYSIWAARAMLHAGYAQYRARNYDEALANLERFISLHPGNENVAYAYYLTAIIHYNQMSDVGRDQRMTEIALENLREVVRRFPDSEYARDARLKMDLTLDHLAGKEMEIGRYYQARGQHNAAIGRFNQVVQDYDTTSHVPEALHRLTESYLALGLIGEAKRTASILGHNFPGSKWYQDSYVNLTGDEDFKREAGGNVLQRTWRRFF